MKVIGSIATLRVACRNAARPLVLVPTMGALHAGHAALIRKARQVAGSEGTVAVSIFVNPIQFNSQEDLATYPQPKAADQRLCQALGVDLLFRPLAKEVYPEDCSVFVEEETLSRGLCGAARPGHFRGVCTVVTKLFHLFAPDAAVFGAKDYQQLAVIRRMVRDLNFAVRIIAHATVREEDGLAMSSRNLRLGVAARAVAPGIYQGLLRARSNAEKYSPSKVLKELRSDLNALPGARVDYVECVNVASLQPVTQWHSSALIAVAVFLDGVRLIDNIEIRGRKVARK